MDRRSPASRAAAMPVITHEDFDELATAVEKIKRFTWQGKSIYPWLRQIAINKVYDVHRQSKRSRRLADAMVHEVSDVRSALRLLDHAGLPLKTVLEQLDILGEEVVPVLRKEFAVGRPAHVPDPPTHASLVAAAVADADEPAVEVA